MHNSIVTTDPAVTAYIAALRVALKRLIVHVQFVQRFPQLGCNTQEAETLLAMDTGREAQEDLALHEELASEAYVLADYLHYQLSGEPRSPSGYVPTTSAIQESLRRIERLTQRSWAPHKVCLRCEAPALLGSRLCAAHGPACEPGSRV